jgi:superfamily I DNA/RNA helicase
MKVSTFHNLKGHEFKVLFVKGVSKDEVPFRNPSYGLYTDLEKREYHKKERSLFYVVFSRAIQSLYISGIGEKSEWF